MCVIDCFRRILGHNLSLITNSTEEIVSAKFKKRRFQKSIILSRMTVTKLKCLKTL